MISSPQFWSPPPTPTNSQDDDVPSQPYCDPLAYLATELLRHAVDFLLLTYLDSRSTTTATSASHAPEDSNAMDDHRAHVSSVMSSSVISHRADGNDAGRDLQTAHPQPHTPAIGNNNGREPPATAKEFLSTVFKRKLGLYLLNFNSSIDLTAIYSSRLDAPHPDEARSSQEPQTHSLAIRSRWRRRRWRRRRER